MESHRVKSLNQDPRSRKRLKFASTKQKAKHTSADVYRKYKRRIGETSASTREEQVHHSKTKRRKVSHEKAVPGGRHNSPNAEKQLQGGDDATNSLFVEDTTLANELDLAMERNGSGAFSGVHRRLWPLVRSLPEIMHNAEKIVVIMLQFLLSPADEPGQPSPDDLFAETEMTGAEAKPRPYFQANHATADIFHLLSVLARDLRHEIHPWMHTHILPRIITDLLNPPPPGPDEKPRPPLDVAVVEAAFRTIAYLLRYDSDHLLSETTNQGGKQQQACLEPMRQYYGATLAHNNVSIRRLAAETFAPLIRKLKPESAKRRHLRRVLRALDASNPTQRLGQNAVDGIANLLFELAKGVAGDFHSKGEIVIDCLLGSALQGSEEWSPTCDVASSLTDRLMKALQPEKAAKILSLAKAQITSLQSNGVQARAADVLVRLTQQIVSYNDGVVVESDEARGAVRFITHQTIEWLQAGKLGIKSEDLICNLLCASWNAFRDDAEFTRFLRDSLSQLLSTAAAGSGVSASFPHSVARHIFACLPHDIAMRDVGSLLLTSADAAKSDDVCLSLVHGVTCMKNTTGDDFTDDTFYPEKAQLCVLPADTVFSLIERILVPAENTRDESQKLATASKCAAFIAACAREKTCFGKCYKKVAKWLTRVVLLSEPDTQRSAQQLVLFASALEAAARLAAIGLERSISPSFIEDVLMQIKPLAEKVVLQNPASPCCLKSISLLCQMLQRFSKHLSADSNAIFEALTPTLSSPCHFKRLHSLRILASFPKKPFVTDHAELDLSEDLDEEPSSAGGSQRKFGVGGLCDMMDVLLEVESLQADHHLERTMALLMSKVEVLGRNDRTPVIYGDAAASHMVGLLYRKFSPFWKPAVRAIASIISAQGKSTWPFIFGRLVALMKTDSERILGRQDIEQPPHLDGFSLDEHFSAVAEWETSQGEQYTLFSERARCASDAGKVSMFDFRQPIHVLESFWELFQTEPSLLVKYSSDVMPVVLEFFENECFTSVDPDGQEIFGNGKTAEVRVSERRCSKQKLLSVLKAFSVLQGPQQLVAHPTLFKVFRVLLQHQDTEVAQTALECILRFKPSFLMPFASMMKGLLERRKFRDSIIALKEDAGNTEMTQADRQKLASVLVRILLGRLSSRSGPKSSKDTPEARRRFVYSFVSGFCTTDEELFPFVYLASRRYLPADARKKAVDDFDEVDRAQSLVKFDAVSTRECGMLPPTVHEGFLHYLEAIISQLGHRVHAWISCFMSILLSLLELYPASASQGRLDCPDEEHAGEIELAEQEFSNKEKASRVRGLCQRRLAEIFKKFSDSYDFTSYGARLWRSLDASVDLLPQSAKTADKTPALLQMLVVLSQNAGVQDLLFCNEKVLKAAVLCIPQSDSVIDAVLTIVENASGILSEREHAKPEHDRVFSSLVPTLLEQFRLRFESFGVTSSWRREFSILGAVFECSKRRVSPEHQDLDKLATLLVPFLELKRCGDRDRLHIIGVVHSIIPYITKDTAGSLYASLSPLLGVLKSGLDGTATTVRHKLATVFSALAEQHLPGARKVCQVLKSLCSVNGQAIDEMDFESVLATLKELRDRECDGAWNRLFSDPECMANLDPVVRICFSFLFNDDGVVARSSFYALKDLVQAVFDAPCESAESESLARQGETFLKKFFIPLIRSGVSCKEESPRRFFILLAAELARVCKSSSSPQLFGDMDKLCCPSDPDLDFFLNITHVQIHRRQRALSRLRKMMSGEGSAELFSVQSLSGILVPIALHPVFESKTSAEEHLATEAISTLGALALALPWRKFHDVLCTLLSQVERQPKQEKFVVGAICAMLGGFHFNVGDPYALENEELESGEVNWKSVWNAFDRRIIPKLERLFTKEKRTQSGEKKKLVRPPVILALLELYQKFPDSVMRRKLPRLLTVLSDALKSRDGSARELARTTLAKLTVATSLEYLPDILRELAVALREGYQVHVRTACVNAMLLEIWEKRFAPDSGDGDDKLTIDSSIPAIVDMIQQDLFGEAQARKDAESSQVRYVKEASGSSGLHCIELAARMVRIDQVKEKFDENECHVFSLFSPFLHRMRLGDRTAKELRRLKECLVRVVQGLSKNKTFSARGTLPLIFATLGPTLITNAQGPIEADAEGVVVEWRPSVVGMADSASDARDNKQRSERMQRTVEDGQNAPKLTGSKRNNQAGSQWNGLDEPGVAASVVFGLQLLRCVLRAGLDENRSQHLGSFVPLLVGCICHSRDAEAVLLAMGCLGDIRTMLIDLPVFEASIEVLGAKTLDLLIGYGGNEELLQASFRLLTLLMEAHKGKEGLRHNSRSPQSLAALDEEQMELLLSFLQTSLTKTSQHNAAVKLVQVLLAREVISPGMYDLMRVVLEQSIRSHTEARRRQCSALYVRFLMNYPMSEERMDKELKQLLVNIQHDTVDGRESAVLTVASVLKKFPEPVVVKHCQTMFVPLTVQLGNDESEKVRFSLSQCLSALLSRLPAEPLQVLLEYTLKWGSNEDNSIKRVSLNVLGIFVEKTSMISNGGANFDNVMNLMAGALCTSACPDSDWEMRYFALLLLEKVYRLPKLDEKVAAAKDLWIGVVKCLSRHHPWVGLAALRLMNQHLQTLDPASFVGDGAETFLTSAGHLFELMQALCYNLGAADDEQNDEVASLVTKALIWVLKASNRYPDLCQGEEMPEASSGDPVRWMFKRLSQAAKPKGTRRRQAIFKCFAAMAQNGNGIAFDHLDLLIEPLHRVERESNNNQTSDIAGKPAHNEEEAQLARDVLGLLERLCLPPDKFIDSYAAIKKLAEDEKIKRKEEARTERLLDPVLAARKKDEERNRAKQRRKRRVADRRAGRSVKSRR